MNRFDKSPGNGRSYFGRRTTYTKVPAMAGCGGQCPGMMDCCQVCVDSTVLEPNESGCYTSCISHCGITDSLK